MPRTLELEDDLYERLESHTEAGETVAEFVEELVSIYETEGTFVQEGYSE
jgi:predicted CopG family antitoxin